MTSLVNVLIYILLHFLGQAVSNVSFIKPIFSTKTPYFWVQDAKEIVINDEFSKTLFNGQTCDVKGLNLLLRHGARYPTEKWIKRMTALQKRMKGFPAITSKYPFINTWINPFNLREEGHLNELGQTEMLKLGERLGKRFKVLLSGKLNQAKYAVTHKERTKSSYIYFYNGLNATFPTDNDRPDATVENRRLRFYKDCDKYIEEVDDNDDSSHELDLFEDGDDVQRVVQKVNNTFGNNVQLQLDIDDVVVIQQICALELGLYNRSDWCTFLDNDILKTIEYMDDLEEYYKAGYGYPITWKQTCPFTSHIFDRFDDAIEEKTSMAPVDIQFGHQDTVLPILTAFRLFEEKDRLTADQFPSNENRTFRTSTIVPFSANIAIALYKCSDSDTFVIQMYVNEKEVIIPGCGRMVCTYEEFKKAYKELVDCDFDQICENDSSNSDQMTPYSATIFVLAFIISIFYQNGLMIYF